MSAHRAQEPAPATVVLRDGGTVQVRAVRPDDEERLARFLRSLSIESLALRFFSAGTDVEARAREWAHPPSGSHALVATAGPGERIAAHAMYVPTRPGTAEVAFTVADEMQGRGLGTLLLGQLAEAASRSGLDSLEALVLQENSRMLDVFRESGFEVQVKSAAGEVRVVLPTRISPATMARFENREQKATSTSIRALLAPKTVAVVGASRERGTIGGEVFHNLISSGFTGTVYPVNPAATSVQSVPAYPSIGDVPGPVDLAVVTVPAGRVVEVARECASKAVRAMVVISAGFAERGGEGARRQAELLDVCRDAGMRLVGPNCMGVQNTAGDIRLNATFAPGFPPPGRVGFLSQSGGLGLAMIEYAQEMGLGISSFVSVGNKADISGNDLLQYWAEDPATDVILLYLESFGNARKFARLARRIGRSKPIVAVKSGRSKAGARAASSHTGALLAASDVTVDALFRQSGVIRSDTLDELFDVASLLASQPLSRGPGVGIVTNVGGPAILCVVACVSLVLVVPQLPVEARRRLSLFLPAEAATGNPVDMLAAAGGADYRRAIEVVATSGAVDAVIVIFTPPLVTRAEDVADAIREAAPSIPPGIPLLSVFLSVRGLPPALSAGSIRIPSYAFPEDAAAALARAAEHAAWRTTAGDQPEPPAGVDDEAAGAIVAGALAKGPGWMPPEGVAAVLRAFGVEMVESAITPDAAGAAAAAARIGFPVALKAIAPGLVHKTEHQAVALGLESREEVESAASTMAARLGAEGLPPAAFLVQRMAPPGVEVLVGVVQDPTFGPVLACGAGGVSAELLKDVAVRLTPIGRRDAAEMIRSLKTFPLLDGYRGAPKTDVAALEDLVHRAGALAEALPAIAEMDLNPVVVSSEGAFVVDARIRLEHPVPTAPLGAR